VQKKLGSAVMQQFKQMHKNLRNDPSLVGKLTGLSTLVDKFNDFNRAKKSNHDPKYVYVPETPQCGYTPLLTSRSPWGLQGVSRGGSLAVRLQGVSRGGSLAVRRAQGANRQASAFRFRGDVLPHAPRDSGGRIRKPALVSARAGYTIRAVSALRARRAA
jgi:hypothetical protein